MSHPSPIKNKDSRYLNLRKLSLHLKIARGAKDNSKAERLALAIITLQRDMGLPISNFDYIFNNAQ